MVTQLFLSFAPETRTAHGYVISLPRITLLLVNACSHWTHLHPHEKLFNINYGPRARAGERALCTQSCVILRNFASNMRATTSTPLADLCKLGPSTSDCELQSEKFCRIYAKWQFIARLRVTAAAKCKCGECRRRDTRKQLVLLARRVTDLDFTVTTWLEREKGGGDYSRPRRSNLPVR